MDEKQQKTLKLFGYSIEELPGKPIPKMTYYRPDGVAMPGLPADPYHLKRYLSRGFTIEPPRLPRPDGQAKLNTETATLELILPQGEFVCETCGKAFKRRVALVGHSRSHKKEK